MDKHIDYINKYDVSINDKLKYINKLPLITVIDILDSYEIGYVEAEVVMFIIIKALQHHTLGIQSLENRYFCKKIHEDIMLFSHVDEIKLYLSNMMNFIHFIKRKEKYAWKYIPCILGKSKTFSNLSKDCMLNIGEKYLGCSWNNIELMTHRIGVVLAIVDNVKRCHIQYYFMTNIWEEMADQQTQQGAIEAMQSKEYFMNDYEPNQNLIKWKIYPYYYSINHDFYNLYKQWIKVHSSRNI